jgi:hypothetical protein
MKLKKRILTAVLLALINGSSQALAWESSQQWGPPELLSLVETSTSGIFVAAPSTTRCGGTQAGMVETDPLQRAQLFALALAAYRTGKPVRLLTYGGCNHSYVPLAGISF